MSDGPVDVGLAALLAELERRRQASEGPDQVDPEEARRTRYGEIAGLLRSNYHEKQAAFFAPGWSSADLIAPEPRPRAARKRAACTTRQSGKTSGGNRETVARCLEAPRRRWVYCISTRKEALERVWRNDSEEGWCDLIRKHGLVVAPNRRRFDDGYGDVLINETYLTIEFRNGSQLDVFAADDEKSADKLRGVTKDGIWIDEAQQFPFLTRFVNSVALPALAKRDGELWMTGTPNEFNDGLFFDVTRDDDIGARLPGWEVHVWSVLDNPGFGATRDERYARTVGREIAERKLDPNDLPADLIREWFGHWVTTAARYVYKIQHLTDDMICYAPLRTTRQMPVFETPDGRRVDLGAILAPTLAPGEVLSWYDHEAAAEDLPLRLPGTKKLIEWRFCLGADFGYDPHLFAWVLWAWSEKLPDIYEMHSWKRKRLIPDYQRDVLLWLWNKIPAIDDISGDPGGAHGNANLEQWRILTGLPIVGAEKTAKPTYIAMFNSEIASRRVHYRRNSPLLHEQRHLMWQQVGKRLEEHQDRRLADGSVPGNDCSDAGLYGWRPMLGRRLAEPPPPVHPGTPEFEALEERRQEEAVDRADAMAESQDDPPASLGWEQWG